MKHDFKNIAINRKYFNYGLTIGRQLVNSKNIESAAIYLSNLARFAYGSTTGYYANWELEKMLNELGGKIKGYQYCRRINNIEKLKICHVASTLYESGGHTQLLFNWIKNDKKNSHNILITNQYSENLPWKKIGFFNLKKEKFNCLINLDTTLLGRAELLRKIVMEYDVIVLHIHPDDIIPVIAFSIKNMPPVLFMNHADHIFWVGASISDAILQIRKNNIDEDKKRRSIIQKQYFLPIPIDNTLLKNNDYKKNRSLLKIDEDVTILLSTASEYKFQPDKTHNLFESILPVLNDNPNILLYIVGISDISEIANKYSHSQIKYLGILDIEQLNLYESVTDIYIESFPYSSFTALLQPAVKKKAIHLMYNPRKIIQIFSGEYPFDYSENIEEWRKNLQTLISDIPFRTQKANNQYDYLIETYSIERWKQLLNSIYIDIPSIKHQIFSNNEDVYFDDEDTIFVNSKDFNSPIRHLNQCQKLPIISKIKHILYYKKNIRPNNVKMDKTELVKFLIKRI